ncbi:hypothetical protein [Pseudotamlana carrageenivorans]|uniref:Uncharacterized protein n=1 Tax=Pseudotamlana carrageenivorans TaxID=2069432 RepID=A0A2I7SKS9_9FLAO|nr:hypothetical protein [Tamlana carrageenivorans]AUS06492.1 hypothetical protein C1A40_14020 [Tamlana carrageenivorans]
MIKIRSTEKLATSNSDGLCDVQRTLSSFTFDLDKQVVKTIVTDVLFQEQTIEQIQEIDGEEQPVNIVERRIVEQRQGVAYQFSVAEIDAFYQNIGSDITKEIGFSTGLKDNLTSVLIAETTSYQRQTMANWVPDTPHVLVNEFTEIEA